MQSNEKQRDRAGDEEGAWMKEHDRHQHWSKFITTTFEAFRAIVKEKVDADQAIKDSVGPGFTEGYVEVNTPETQAAYGVVQQLQLMRKKFEKVRRHDGYCLFKPACMGCSCIWCGCKDQTTSEMQAFMSQFVYPLAAQTVRTKRMH